MHSNVLQRKYNQLLQVADIQPNGIRPWDMQIHNHSLYSQVFTRGTLGLGEAYVKGWWDASRLDEFFVHALKAHLSEHLTSLIHTMMRLRSRWQNLQTTGRVRRVGELHYDLGNDLYRAMLDRRMIYSCGYWKNARNLDEAQEAKLDLIARKLYLKPGMRVLDIGCGWGGTAQYLAQRYGVEVVGITISHEQAEYARLLCRDLPVSILEQDYRTVQERFDRIVSVGMFEHVGYKNYPTFMQVLRRNLKPEGLCLLHTIGKNKTDYLTDPWISRYIFPNSIVPSPSKLTQALEGQLVIEDWHNFGEDYDDTLMHWYQNFKQHWPELREHYDEEFYRMWEYYLMCSAACFRSRYLQLWQIVLSPNGMSGGYESLR